MSMNLAIVDGPDFPIQTPTNLTYEALALGDKTDGDAMARDAVVLQRALEYALSCCKGGEEDDFWRVELKQKFASVSKLLARRAPYSERQIVME